jgi:molybdenum cofactor cytidylyltransferase
VDGILLAAGSSVRFGSNKLLYQLHGKPVYRYVLEILYDKRKERLLDRVIVVSQYDEIFDDIKREFPGVEMVRNSVPALGISASVRLGLERLEEGARESEGCLFAVADQPGLTAESVEKLVRFWRQNPLGIAAACHEGQMGNPVIFSSAYYEELRMLKGDQGGKAVLRRHMEDVGLCQIPARELEDVDTPEDAERIQ